MVVKRSCSFCAGEIEPGTGSMFVKRDGQVFHFCSSSCRKQQMHLGRVGHRLKWTRAHALKKAAEQAGPKMAAGTPVVRPARARRGAGSSRPDAGTPTTPTAPKAPEPPAAPAAPAEASSAAPKKTPKRAKSGPASPPA